MPRTESAVVNAESGQRLDISASQDCVVYTGEASSHFAQVLLASILLLCLPPGPSLYRPLEGMSRSGQRCIVFDISDN